MPRAPVLTLSGYPKRDAYRAFDAALAERDAERACCLAAELACTPREPRALASHLVDVFAEAYATLDPRAVVRLAGALARFQPGAREERRALCEAVIVLAIGLPRHDALADVLKRCPPARKGAGGPPDAAREPRALPEPRRSGSKGRR